MGVYDFLDLTLKESGVTSKGLNKYRRGGNHSHSAAWILISYLAQGRTRGGRFSDAGRLQSTLKNQQIKKEGSRGGGVTTLRSCSSEAFWINVQRAAHGAK